MSQTTPAQLYATLVGGVLVVVGVIGFFYEASFDTGDQVVAGDVFGLFAVNGWHNLVHLALGLVGLAVAGFAARTYALAVGLLFVVLAIWGFIAVDDGAGTLLDLVPVDTADNLLHLVLGLTGLAAGAASAQPAGEPQRQRRPARG